MKETCENLRELIPLYVAGALPEDAARRVESQLPHCPDAQQDLADYRALTDAMLLAVPDAGAPPPVEALLARVQRYERTSAQMTPRRVTVMPPPRRWMLWGAAASLILFAVLMSALITANVYLISQITALRDSQTQLASLIASAPTPANTFNVSRSGQDHHRQLTANLDDVPAESAALITWNSTDRIGALFVQHMPPLPAGHVYQLWVVKGAEAQVVSLGVFSINEQGAGTLTFKADVPLESFDAVGITVEPSSGSPSPTTPHMLIAQL